MKKNKFYKNLFQSISYFSVIMVFVFLLLIGYFESLNFEDNFGWILLIISISLIILYFLLGFYWIFQKVLIDEKGIQVIFIKKTIKEYSWKDIYSIEKASIMKNPALRIKLLNGAEIHLDKRKSILHSLEYYGDDTIQHEVMNLIAADYEGKENNLF